MEEVWKYKDIKVHWSKETDGGGKWFGIDYLSLLPKIYPNKTFNHAMEWCAGPGFIGFSLLANGLCEELTLFEFYEPAVELLHKTKMNNPKYSDRINIIHSDKISSIPENQKYDLIVSNPPHFESAESWEKSLIDNQDGDIKDFMTQDFIRMSVDLNWETHKEFFEHIGKNLADDGVIVLQENSIGSNPSTFSDMITNNNLILTDVFTTDFIILNYLEIKHRK